MNKLIKRFFLPSSPVHAFFPPPHLKSFLANQKVREREREREREGRKKKERKLEWDRECLRMQKYNRGEEKIKKEEEWSRLERREKEPDELLEWCAPQSPLAYPKIPGAGNVKARRTTDAIPQRGSAGIISEGNGGLKWRTNFSKTSSERNLHALRLFLPLPWSPPPSFSLSPPSSSSFFYFFFLCVVFQTRHHSSTKLIFLKIKGRTTLN